jgi:3-methylfumaryl-CoA hydratase
VSDFEDIAADWRPEPAAVTGPIEAGPTAKLAALLGVPNPTVLPPLWHEVHLRDAVGLESMGDDGHPQSGALLPPLADRRRMFGGGTVEQVAALNVGDVATRTSKVADVRVRQGRSGTLLLVTEEHVWTVQGEERLREKRDIVYRRAADIGAPVVPDSETRPTGEVLTADQRYLFAYSALTYNLHRIHYDDRYVREVEHHPALVVHGPLLALWCAEHARRRLGAAPSRISYRLTSTAYVGQPVGIFSREQEGTLNVEAISQGRTCVKMTATA